MNRVNQGISGYVGAFSDVAFNLLPILLYLILSVAAMLRMEWRLAVAVIVFTPLPALIGARAAPEQMRRERRLVERWSSIYSRFNEVLAGIMTVKGYVMEEEEKRRFLQGVREGNEIVRRGVRTDNFTGTLRTMSSTTARLGALALGGYLALAGTDHRRYPGGIPGVYRRSLWPGARSHQRLSDLPASERLAGNDLWYPRRRRPRGRYARRLRGPPTSTERWSSAM